ncbi:probable LRR receptor-like serine/threonine-protein kinase At1g29720 isoform X2 [Rutidosis leptorrhynchoides]|uniref:probable LRR receptor-like serine/threonine-protein kinase At1g29720 isoform X2 n=1 Tax=Rutidosis leptorrhynchoides TaxID=125765 RepID=UPI003A992609
MLVIILIVALLPFGFASMDTSCLPTDEVDALSVIGRKLGKDWNFEGPCCSWITTKTRYYVDSILCNVNCGSNTTCHVVSISLKGQSLPGTLPPELVKLPYLQNIDLARNFLSGTIPPEWGSMEQLLNISLLGNRLNGSIPKELGNISTLTTLTVEDNQMSGIIPEELGNFASIQRLLLSSNYFTGELPASFARLTKMMEFGLGGNNFSGKIPDFIGNWTNLTSLRMYGSGLEGPIPPSITLLSNLSDLRISDLRGPDTVCPPFSNITPFITLILRSCNLIGSLPEPAPSVTQILDFSFNKFNGSIPEDYDALEQTNYIYLTGNRLSESVPDWMLTLGETIDLSYNNFTYDSSKGLFCPKRDTNLFQSFSTDNISKKAECLTDIVCPRNSYSWYINCGGNTQLVGDKLYEGDIDPKSGFLLTDNRWAFSNTGSFLDDSNLDSYTETNLTGVPLKYSELYATARVSALSLTYNAFCMMNGNYTVSLHFAEIVFTDDGTYTSLGRRVFDIYIQGDLVEKDFDISEKAGGVRKAIVKNYTADVIASSLEIRLYWAGKGTTNLPFRGVYGPLISAISVNPNFLVPNEVEENDKGVSRGTVAAIVVGVVCGVVLILGVLWWWGYLRQRDTNELELNGIIGSFTLRQIKNATNNFDVTNKIGQGGFGSVYKGVMPDGTLIAVKQLSSKSRQGNREFLNELGMISALQHPHLVKLHGCCIEGNQLLLAYEYMENNSLARALFGPEEHQLELNWATRYRICIDIARGLTFLHEESQLKIVHRDIKATNVLLNENLNAKISDFGLAKLDEEDDTHISTRIAGTYGYMAPEYALRGYLTDKADVYSYGIVLLEIVSGMANVSDRSKENQFVLHDKAVALKNSGNLLELVDPRLGSAYDLQEMMTVINVALVCTASSSADRPTMSSVVGMLESRICPEEFVAEQSLTMTEYHREKMMKLLGSANDNQVRETSFTYTDSSTSAVDLYPNDRFSEYMLKRGDSEKRDDSQQLLL